MLKLQYHSAFHNLLHNYHILRYVNQPTGEVTGIRCFKGRIGQTFTGTVGRDKVFQYTQSVFKVGQDRVLNDLRS
jgi:hypothetical protein